MPENKSKNPRFKVSFTVEVGEEASSIGEHILAVETTIRDLITNSQVDFQIEDQIQVTPVVDIVERLNDLLSADTLHDIGLILKLQTHILDKSTAIRQSIERLKTLNPDKGEPTPDDVNNGLAHWTICTCGQIAQQHHKDGTCKESHCMAYKGKIVWNIPVGERQEQKV